MGCTGALDDLTEPKNNKMFTELKKALESETNIVPVTDNFQWPEERELPPEIMGLAYFNSVRWIHDYQLACVNKLERFIRGEVTVTVDSPTDSFGSPVKSSCSRRPSGVLTPGGRFTRKGSNTSLYAQSLSSSLLLVPSGLSRSSQSLA